MKPNFTLAVLLLLLFGRLTAQPGQQPMLYLDGPQQLACVRDDVPYIVSLLRADKTATLQSVKTATLQRLQEHAAEPYYIDKRPYAHIEIGNLFSKTVKHALVAYFSDAHLKSNSDYYLNLYVYEIKGNVLEQVFKAENMSAYYQTIGIDITDFNHDGSPDVLVATNEPEWYHNDRPVRLYYHLFQYNSQPALPLLTEYKPLLNIPNPHFINPGILYSNSDCGCSGYCWFSKLFLVQNNELKQLAEAGQYCTNVASVYQLGNNGSRTLIAEIMQASIHDTEYIENVWLDLIPRLTAK